MASDDGRLGEGDEKEAAFWDRVRRDFEDPALSLKTICARHGLSLSQLYRYRKKHGWPPRKRGQKQRARNKADVIRKGARGRSALKRRLEMIERLYTMLERELQDFEKMGAGDSDEPPAVPSGADRERSARTLTSLIRSFDKICEFDDKAQEAQRRAQHSGTALPETDADGLRLKIAQRLERLLADRGTGEVSGRSDGS